ncbi:MULTISPECIES: response regulator [unclassified Pseudomonas]|uniref:response regulator n=1 Tax=unclassified Pseudomonas TaxID=196821 RepID=UPI002AC9563C|nr:MULTISPECIES: response regulator [unclassified Pseudomonas]MEB0040806.1 response regulator [Pseudomonas sp. MH10]MEB0122975.1 response regulator [Pseudomonas sp. CCI1.2]WPX65061.1 response regulator [Pseudomonas sp. MH10]
MSKNNLRILLVEDHPFQLIATQILLNNQGYFRLTPVLSAGEAMQAMETASEPFDVLLCDQCLTDLTGLELIILASQQGLIHKAVLLSGLSDEQLQELEQKARVLRLPLLGCLSKPLKVQALTDLLENADAHFTYRRE